MKTKLLLALLVLATTQQLVAQKACSTSDYQQEQLRKDPSLAATISNVEAFTRQYIAANSNTNQAARGRDNVIKIPVVVHILYHYPSQNISDAKVASQIDVLNKTFRRTHADTIKTPAAFRPVAADCEIEFQLAISDPKRRNTTGIIRKYTPVEYWEADDKMKFEAETGAAAWDAKNYLNIWVCDLRSVAGYASVPGGPADKDGIVLDFSVFGTGGTAGFNMGKTAVHEVGHWLNLRHIWGDESCGDDFVHDTPKQSWYNVGCPTSSRITCGNGPNGDMYMNYMDFTDDDCMNLFTLGQKNRMRALFSNGGSRASLLNSTGLRQPLVQEIPVPDAAPTWLHVQLFPNPATDEITIDMAYDARWIGRTLNVLNAQGQVALQIPVTSKIQVVNISRLQPGIYFLAGKREDGVSIQQKFIKR
jgi:hypothetical protein